MAEKKTVAQVTDEMMEIIRKKYDEIYPIDTDNQNRVSIRNASMRVLRDDVVFLAEAGYRKDIDSKKDAIASILKLYRIKFYGSGSHKEYIELIRDFEKLLEALLED